MQTSAANQLEFARKSAPIVDSSRITAYAARSSFLQFLAVENKAKSQNRVQGSVANHCIVIACIVSNAPPTLCCLAWFTRAPLEHGLREPHLFKSLPSL